MGIQEFWRFDGESLRIFMLKDGVYQEEAASPTFPRISKEQLYQFLAESAKSEVQASRNLRRWIQALLKK